MLGFRALGHLLAAGLVTACLLVTPSSAQAYRRGLAASIGGATLGHGHLLWLAAGYPSTRIGWAVAVHPRIDLGLLAAVTYVSPVELGHGLVGGGGGGRARFALSRGRLSTALALEVTAIAYGEGAGSVVLITLGDPSLEVSIRVHDRVAVHASIAVLINYISLPSQALSGAEASVGLTVALTDRLALFGCASYGITIWNVPPRRGDSYNAHQGGTPRLEVMAGLELLLGRQRKDAE